MSLRRSLLAGALFLAVLPACRGRGADAPGKVARGGSLAITNVRVFDGERVMPATDVLVDGATIVAVGRDLERPAGIETVDGTGRTLLPGLIDAHAHVYEGAHLEQALAFGVTTVLDMFSIPSDTKPLRAENHPDRADLRSAGILATAPGGHGTEYGFAIPTIAKPADAAAFVDARLAEGSDYLKIVFDGGAAYGKTIPTLDVPTLRALIEAAHARKKLAVVHIGSYDEARTSIESGADGLVHLFRDRAPDADFGALVARHRAFVTPTLTVLRSLQGGTSPIGDDPAIAPLLTQEAKASLVATFPIRAKATPNATETAIAQLRAANVPILVGTDAPNPGTTYGASIHDELALLVAAGLTATEALAGATALPARRFALDDRGRIATGLRADLVLVEGDPTTTIADTRRIVAIWRGGAKLDRAAYQARIANADAAASPAAIGPISDFEDGALAVRFGQPWIASTDVRLGGTSNAELTVIDGGAGSRRKALAITGTVVAHQPASWAGALFSPGTRAFAPADLSTKKELAFQAKGDGKTYVVMVFAQSRGGGRVPVVRTFRPGKEFAPAAFAWSEFDGLTGGDIMAIFIGQSEPGPFRLVIDDVAVK